MGARFNSSVGLRVGWLFPIALLLQIGAMVAQDRGILSLSLPWLMGGSYLLLLLGAVRNLHLWGFRLFLLGVVLNLLAMVLNGWHMPVSPEALIQAGFTEEASLESGSYLPSSKSVLLLKEDTRAWFLTDIFAVTRPVRRVASVGDLFIIGALVLILVELAVRRRPPLDEKCT